MRNVGRTVEIGLALAGIVLLAGVLVYAVWPGDPSTASGHQMPGMQSMPGMAKVHGDGLSDSHDGFRLVAEQLPSKRGDAEPVAFRLLNRSGEPETRYRLHQSKRLHLIVVRDDMHAFQHVHPALDGETWRAKVSVPDGGQYRMFAEFVPESGQRQAHPVLVGAPFTIAGDTTFKPLPAPAAKVTVDGYTVSRPDGTAQPIVDQPQVLRFKVTDGAGKPAQLQTYLDSYAHVTAFNAMTMAATHLHPVQQPGTPLPDDELTVRATFSQRGEHRVFVEFKAGGKVRQAAFTVFVT